MGLDLFCGAESTRMGSYGYVHTQRWAWIRANREHACSRLDDKQDREACVLRWNACLLREGRFSPVLDYDYIHQTMKREMLPGVYTFVYHSDADGSWSDAEATSMLEAIQQLRPWFSKIPELEREMEDGEYYLESLFRSSRNTGNAIYFG